MFIIKMSNAVGGSSPYNYIGLKFRKIVPKWAT